MPEEDESGCKVEESLEIVSMEFIPGDEAAEVEEPGEEPLDFPPSTVTAKRAAVLGLVSSVGTMWGDQLDAAFISKALVEGVTVISPVADHAVGLLVEQHLIEGCLDQRHFVGCSTSDPKGERKTSAVCHCHDLGPLSLLGFPDARPPFLAPAKEPSMKVSLRSKPPLSLRSRANASSNRWSVPLRTQSWNRRWHVWYEGYRLGISAQGAPVRKTHKTAFKTSRGSRQGRPRPSRRIRCFGRSGPNTFHCASVRSILHFKHTHLTHSEILSR